MLGPCMLSVTRGFTFRSLLGYRLMVFLTYMYRVFANGVGASIPPHTHMDKTWAINMRKTWAINMRKTWAINMRTTWAIKNWSQHLLRLIPHFSKWATTA